MSTDPRLLAEHIRDAFTGCPPPEDAAEAYELMQAMAHLAEAVGGLMHDYGEAVTEHTNLNPAITEALHEAGDGARATADRLRDIPPPPPEVRRDERGQVVPDWVTPYTGPAYPGRYDYDEPAVSGPKHIRYDDRGTPPPPGTLRSGPRPEPDDHHKTFTPSYYGTEPPPARRISPKEAHRRGRKARKHATPREEPGQWAAKWAQILFSKNP
jgi:hypothetical protein